jgi:hypothetical protein
LRLLLDECVDRRLARDLAPHDARTVPQMGWAGRRNGELLRLAEQQFDVFITVDRNLSFQQNLSHLGVAILVLHAPSNRLGVLRLLGPNILAALPTLVAGSVSTVKL